LFFGERSNDLVNCRAAAGPHARISPLNSERSLWTSDARNRFRRSHWRAWGRVLIRIIKPLPAPKMDGFDVRGLSVHHIYNVDSRLGRYLIVAGYGEALHETINDKTKPREPK